MMKSNNEEITFKMTNIHPATEEEFHTPKRFGARASNLLTDAVTITKKTKGVARPEVGSYCSEKNEVTIVASDPSDVVFTICKRDIETYTLRCRSEASGVFPSELYYEVNFCGGEVRRITKFAGAGIGAGIGSGVDAVSVQYVVLDGAVVSVSIGGESGEVYAIIDCIEPRISILGDVPMHGPYWNVINAHREIVSRGFTATLSPKLEDLMHQDISQLIMSWIEYMDSF
jgi:hypothetical protein